MWRTKRKAAFALYEVLIGVSIFVIGVITIGQAVQNCLNASTLGAEEERIREILSNRMAEIQTAPGLPDVSKQTKIETGYGTVTLIQKSTPANLTEPDAGRLTNLTIVTLTAQWQRGTMGGGVVHHVERSENVMAQWIRSNEAADTQQSLSIEFYVYRPG